VSVLDNRIPPPLVALVLAGGMWGLAQVAPALGLEFAIRAPLAVAIALIGAAFDFSGLYAFLRKKTTINPLKPERASALVTGGVYRFTRNPMYVGMLLFLLAWSAYLDCLLAFAGPVLFVLYMNRFQIGPEERVLREKFGAPFEAYMGEVRRWL
jgi:protein-S-isoprenylcysteine O-methyltransferase Ste14